MRVFLALLLLIAGQSGAFPAAQNDRVTFRFFLGDIFRMYGQVSTDDRPPLATYCEVFAKDEAERQQNSETWKGMVSECFGYAQLSDEDGYPLAACAYFIEAATHYKKARPEPYEVEALDRSREEMAQQIAGLGC